MLAVLCVLILAGILVAGLWPFHAPLNDVAWQETTGGLVFGKHGTVLGSGKFKAFGANGGDSWSLEMWLQPEFLHDTDTLLSVYSEQQPVKFRIRRFQKGIVLRGKPSHQKGSRTAEAYIPDILNQGQLRLVTIASGADGTNVYLNGTLYEHKPYFQLSAESLNGQLVVGDSTIERDSWSGLFKGLALYDRELTEAGASRHYESWKREGRPDIRESEAIMALYSFDERHGSLVHNHEGSGTDLIIPGRYTILHEKFLDAPWNEFHSDWDYMSNVLINIGGFMPLGFFFYAYWLATRQHGPIAIATVLFGFLVSLTIEIAQSKLPTRDSGATDLITNTFGTYLGVALYRRLSGRLSWGIKAASSGSFRVGEFFHLRPPKTRFKLDSWVGWEKSDPRTRRCRLWRM